MAFAIVFDSVGAGEWLVLLAVLLVVVGPKRLPSVIRSFGNHYAKFRRAAESFKRQIMEMDTEFERAVNDAAREAEDAARIPDLDMSEPEPSDASAASRYPEYPESPEAPEEGEMPEPHDAPEAPGAADVAAAAEPPETPAAPEGTDGDRASQES